MTRWFRHYAGMMRDDKLVRAALKSGQPVERVVWVWGCILESASEIDDGGRYEIDHAEMAYFLRADESDLAAVEDALSALGRVVGGVVANWKDRQFQSDRSAERQRRYRDRLKGQSDGDEPSEQQSRDDDVTSLSRHGDAPETETELEADTERNISLDAEREFEAWYLAFPKHVGKGQARRAYRAARKKADASTLLMAAQSAAAFYATGDPQFTPNPATWLNGERWLDGRIAGRSQRYDWDADPANRNVL